MMMMIIMIRSPFRRDFSLRSQNNLRMLKSKQKPQKNIPALQMGLSDRG